jgi:hypothetical protein
MDRSRTHNLPFQSLPGGRPPARSPRLTAYPDHVDLNAEISIQIHGWYTSSCLLISQLRLFPLFGFIFLSLTQDFLGTLTLGLSLTYPLVPRAVF